MIPLHIRGARQAAATMADSLQIDPATDPLLATPFDPASHADALANQPAELLAALHTVEHATDPADGRVTRVRRQLWWMQHGRPRLPLGLIPLAVQCRAWLSGVPLQTVPADPAAFPAARDPLVPATLARSKRAVVRYGSGVSVTGLMADAFRALGGRAAIVCKNLRTVGQVVADLRQEGVHAEGYFENAIDTRPRPAVAVGTPAGLASPSAAVDHVDLVVALDPVEFCGPRGIGLRMERNLVTTHWLGMLPVDRPTSPLERDLLTALFGPFQFELPAHGQVTRQVLFAQQSIVLPPGRGYDRVVMALAGDLAGADRQDGDRFAVVRRAGDITGPVTVLAEDDRQRRALQRIQRAADCDRVQVVTPDELSRLADVDILVRTDRRSHRPPLSRAALVEPQVARAPLLVVDAVSPNDERLARQRVAAYRAEGWVSLDAHRGGWGDWERWLHRRLPGKPSSDKS